jgi:hypothetical protein
MKKAIAITILCLTLPALAWAGATPSAGSEEGVIRFSLDIDWWYSLTTLVFRFLMIFFMLLLLQVSMQLSGYVFTQADGKKIGNGASATEGANGVSDNIADEQAGTTAALDHEIAAAIGMALYQATKVPESRFTSASAASQPGAIVSGWISAGRSIQIMSNQNFGGRNWIKRIRKLK